MSVARSIPALWEPEPPNSADVREPTPYLWSRDEYYRLAELGFFEGKRVELIEGEVFEMPPMLSPHVTAVRLSANTLERAFGPAYHARSQVPLSLGDRSDPEPDVAVVPGDVRDYASQHPTTAALIVEVSDSTLNYDRATKGSLYARAGIVEYWILNLKARQLEVYRDPVADAEAIHGHRYSTVKIFRAKDSVSPLGAPAAKIKVADMLP